MMLIISVLASTVIGYRPPLCLCLCLCPCPLPLPLPFTSASASALALALAFALALCVGPTLKFTISGRIALQRMQEAEGVTPVLETEVGLADQDVEVAGVVETHLKVVILIELDSLSKGAMSSQSI